MKKKVWAFLLIFVLLFTLSACNAPKEEPVAVDDNILIAMVTDTNGFGKDSFNDAALVGLEKAKTDFGIEIAVYESTTADDYESLLTLAAGRGADLVISRGFLMADATKIVAENFPNTQFAILDYADVVADNVAAITFNEQEGSFLMGVIAALASETKILGFVGGMQFPADERFEYGFKAGVKAVNPALEVLSNYTGSYSDESLEKEAALEQHQLGADVIYHATDQFGSGIIEAASEQGFWAIGVGQDQADSSSDSVLCSMIKKIEKVMYLTIKAFVKDELQMGKVVFGLAEDGVGFEDKSNNIDIAIVETVDQYTKLIIDGKIDVPYDLATFEAFNAPKL